MTGKLPNSRLMETVGKKSVHFDILYTFDQCTLKDFKVNMTFTEQIWCKLGSFSVQSILEMASYLESV